MALDGPHELLTTDEIARFVARGFLALPGVINDELNEAAIDQCHTRRPGRHRSTSVQCHE